MTEAIDKTAILAALRDRLEIDLAAATDSQRKTQEGATHPEARPENDKDTRATEASYLARGLAERVGALRLGLSQLAVLPLRSFGEDSPAALTACVQVKDAEGTSATYFLAPGGGGLRLVVGGRTVTVVTPTSPLGRALIGRRVEDEVKVPTPKRGPRILEITAID